MPLAKRKILDDILEDIDLGGVPHYIKNRLISIVQRTMKAFSLTPGDIGCFNGFEVSLKLKEGRKPPPPQNYTISQEKQVLPFAFLALEGCYPCESSNDRGEDPLQPFKDKKPLAHPSCEVGMVLLTRPNIKYVHDLTSPKGTKDYYGYGVIDPEVLQNRDASK